MLTQVLEPARSEPPVQLLSSLDAGAVVRLMEHCGLRLRWIEPGAPVPGSYWGEPEAGLIGAEIFARADTPVHSLLHEACHFLCMDATRRGTLHTDAGGTDTEENAVCYLQCLLADALPGYSRRDCFRDMDAWGYHFILGSAGAWFENDADDARRWLDTHLPAWPQLAHEAAQFIGHRRTHDQLG
jgi:hypothetical protein